MPGTSSLAGELPSKSESPQAPSPPRIQTKEATSKAQQRPQGWFPRSGHTRSAGPIRHDWQLKSAAGKPPRSAPKPQTARQGQVKAARQKATLGNSSQTTCGLCRERIRSLAQDHGAHHKPADAAAAAATTKQNPPPRRTPRTRGLRPREHCKPRHPREPRKPRVPLRAPPPARTPRKPIAIMSRHILPNAMAAAPPPSLPLLLSLCPEQSNTRGSLHPP